MMLIVYIRTEYIHCEMVIDNTMTNSLWRVASKNLMLCELNRCNLKRYSVEMTMISEKENKFQLVRALHEFDLVLD